MIRTLAAAGGLSLAALAPIGLAGGAAAQTWGQPVYVSPYGGTPLSEVETRPYSHTGRWADGSSGPAYVYVPAPVYGSRHAYRRDDGDRYGHGYGRGRGYGHAPHERRRGEGYRDVWGYNDDRPTSARGWSGERRFDRDCGCGDVYLYDR